MRINVPVIFFPIRLFGLLCVALLPLYAIAGGGPETTLVVVNSQSPLSKRIANEYVRLRDIPENHIVWLDGVPSMDAISIDDFRKKIWSPIREFIRSNQLEEEIDIITYSGNFPYAVNFRSDLSENNHQKNKYIGNIASLTSMTYFAHRVEAKDTGYLEKNFYFRDFSGPEKKTQSLSLAAPVRLSKKQIKQLRRKAKKQLNKPDTMAEAESYYQKIVDSYPELAENWYDLARSQAAIQKWDRTLESLATAVDLGWTNSPYTEREEYFKPLHQNTRFHELLKQMETAYGPFLLTNGFRHHYVWSNAGLDHWESSDSLDQYYLSTMLAYTGERGNSYPEIMNYLTKAASSDGTHPGGSVYLLENPNVRSKTRQHLFPVTINELAKRGRHAELLYKGADEQNGIIPISKTDVMGVVVGFPDFKWEDSNSVLLPGAIAESLTSYGGHFNKPKQTKLTAFLRHGAAGSSGAVAEPFAFQEKFPVPMIHAWYADGCSLAEAFYQSVQVPYQLIIVGDPLTRPFASFADIKLRSPDLQEPWSGEVTIGVEIQPAQGKAIKKTEFWVDGQYQFDVPVGHSFLWDTGNVEDGGHEIRLVAIEDSHIETRSSSSFNIQVYNHSHRIHVAPVKQVASYKDTIELTGTAPGADKVELVRGYSIMAETGVKGSQWRLSIPSSIFGPGPVSFFVRAIYRDGTTVRSPPVRLSIGLPEYSMPALEEKPSGKGLSAVIYDKENKKYQQVIEQLNGPLKLENVSKNKITASRLKLTGYFYVEHDGFYQLVIAASGVLKLAVNDQILVDKATSDHDSDTFLPLMLKRGWHRFESDLKLSGRPYLKVVLEGEQIPLMLSGDILGHFIPVTDVQAEQQITQ